MSSKNNLKIYCDGGARGNPGPAASAFVVTDSLGNEVFKQGYYLGQATNNQAEYSAVLKALEWFIKSGFSNNNLTFYLDSLLVTCQLKGIYKIKDNLLKEYHSRIQNLIKTYNVQVLGYVHISRSLNTRADTVVNGVLDSIYQG